MEYIIIVQICGVVASLQPMSKPKNNQQYPIPDPMNENPETQKKSRKQKKKEKKLAEEEKNREIMPKSEETLELTEENKLETMVLSLFEKFENRLLEQLDPLLQSNINAEVRQPPMKRRKFSTSNDEIDSDSEREMSHMKNYSENDIEEITEAVGNTLLQGIELQKAYRNPFVEQSLAKYGKVSTPLPDVSAKAKMKMCNFTKFKRGSNLLYCLNVIRNQFIHCKIANDQAFLHVPELIEEPRLYKWAQHMIGAKELEWPDIVKVLAMKSSDFTESSKALSRLETMKWKNESAASFIKNFVETFERDAIG